MEINLEEPIHVEFYGLPGSGKSTISHKLANYIRELGYEVEEPTYEIDHNNSVVARKIKKLSKTLLFVCLKRNLYIKIKENLSYNFWGNYKEISKNLVNIIPKINKYITANNKIYIWDEGLVQSSISISIEGKNNVERNKNELFKPTNYKSKKVLLIYVDEDIEVVLERLRQRKDNDSRAEKEQNLFKRVKMLQEIKELCDSIGGDEIKKISSNIEVEHLYKYICEFLST